MVYPEQYANEQNWFAANATVRVVEKLAIEVPEYSMAPSKETHHYMLPPQTLTRVETNKEVKLNLAFAGRQERGDNPLISLQGDAIRTHSKPGKATIMVEDGQGFSDQIVMLNVIVEDIFALITMARCHGLLRLTLSAPRLLTHGPSPLPERACLPICQQY